LPGDWAVCSPDTVLNFSAVGYFFGRELHNELNVPIGLINTSWGGTVCEAWTSEEALKEGGFDTILKRSKGAKQGPNNASVLYNAMLAPLIPYGIRGAIWYQGESNRGRAYQYRELFPTMIRDWRERWGSGNFPFLFVQLAPFNYGNPDDPACAELREAQTMTLSLPNTGMAVTTDIGNVKDIHPKNKQEVGRRLALWALANSYDKDLVYSGPLYKSMKVEGGKARITFDHTGGGLKSLDGKPLTEFAIAGEDKQFVPAQAKIEGDSVVVFSDEVDKPVAVRFGWRNAAEPNLANEEGLPASPFRTDDFKGVTAGNS